MPGPIDELETQRPGTLARSVEADAQFGQKSTQALTPF
jgi:hypothetical protein